MEAKERRAINSEFAGFWDRVVELMHKQGYTQGTFSMACGFGDKRINNLVTYLRSPTINEAAAIARTLDVSLEYLITGEAPHFQSVNTAVVSTRLKEIKRIADELETAFHGGEIN